MKWIKIVADFCDDEKTKIIRDSEGGDTFIWIWLWMLTTAMKKESDTLYLVGATPYDPGMIARLADVKEDAAHKAIALFERLGMIEFTESGGIFIVNWSKHQSMTAMIEKRESARIRKEREREKKREFLLSNESLVTRDTCDSHATEENRREEKRIEVKTLKNCRASAPAFPASTYELVESSFSTAYHDRTGSPYPATGSAISSGRKTMQGLLKSGITPERLAELARDYVKEADGKYKKLTVHAFCADVPNMIAAGSKSTKQTWPARLAELKQEYRAFGMSDSLIESYKKEWERDHAAR